MGEASSDVAAQAAAVRVLAVSRVAPSVLGESQRLERLKLSLFDTPWVVLPPIQRVFLYELGEDGGGDQGFRAVVERLKRALADTLAHYLPLSGRLEYVADTEDVFVDCSDAGVAFVEAEGDIDVRRLAGDEEHDIPAFMSLVPELDALVLPVPVLSVQATRLGAGLAVGLSVHHAVADGRAVWRFMEAWASASREGSPVTKALGPPHYGREAVAHPNGDVLGREMLKTVAPNLPAENNNDVGSDDESFHKKARHVFRRLHTDEIKDYWVGDVVKCPFCRRSIANDFLSVMRHGETIGSSHSNMGEDVKVYAFMANHKAFGIHLRKMRNLAIEQDAIAPPKPKPQNILGQGSKKNKKRMREKAMRRG